ncbi:MAG: SPOR domain-containing protein [Terriglobia bacterium]
MAKGKGGAYEMVLETRHLVGVFFAVVILCAVFFTLGFVLGRNQERAAAHTAELESRSTTQPMPSAAESPSSPTPTDLGFYGRVGKAQPATSSPKPVAPPVPKSTPPSSPTGTSAGSSAAASILLQVAAITQKDDAERLQKELRRLGFPTVIVPPTSGRFYRVQVGPFTDPELAAAAQRRLEAQGFTVLVKR